MRNGGPIIGLSQTAAETAIHSEVVILRPDPTIIRLSWVYSRPTVPSLGTDDRRYSAPQTAPEKQRTVSPDQVLQEGSARSICPRHFIDLVYFDRFRN